jgi:hypothetical protein
MGINEECGVVNLYELSENNECEKESLIQIKGIEIDKENNCLDFVNGTLFYYNKKIKDYQFFLKK